MQLSHINNISITGITAICLLKTIFSIFSYVLLSVLLLFLGYIP